MYEASERHGASRRFLALDIDAAALVTSAIPLKAGTGGLTPPRSPERLLSLAACDSVEFT